MKDSITIYTNLKNSNFIKQILTDYNLNFVSIENFNIDKNKNDLGIILIDEINHDNIFREGFERISKNYLLITNSKNFQKSSKFAYDMITSTNSPSYIRNKVDKFLLSKKITFENISILDKKLINEDNNKSCYLTDIEKEILIYLIKNENCMKDYIKKNILKIKTSIETNSLDSHLFRIRKKIDEINANLLIQSKYDSINIYSNQKNLD